MKTRAVTRWREIEHTEAGETRLITEPYTVNIPVPSRDWDHIVLNTVTTAALGFTAVSVAWSTVSAGALLAAAGPAAVAYPVAAAYDAAWLTCMGLEWLSRYDPDRARAPRRAGHVFLLVAVAVIFAHGYLDVGFVVGAAGAVISAIAKGLWSLVLGHIAQPLPDRTRAWLGVRRAELTAQLALGAQQRQLTRMQEQHAALLSGLPSTGAQPDTSPDTAADVSATVRAAVRAAAATLPSATAADITDHLATVGIDTDEDTVRTVLDTSPDTLDSRSTGRVQPLAPRGQSIADSVRTALASGITDKSAVLSYVRTIHGQYVSSDTVARTLNRIERAS
ncbi:protein transporter Sec31 [Streptomyces tremellae]|uniref:Protein transporter Sec31 n=1 Tax=Streptomyces tremellae TaxID=1124239 RepID=A0ABP7EJW2_9ACTN